MRGFIGNTDYDWFTFLSARDDVDEVNFWQPSAFGFNAAPGTPFFFRLKAPHNAIAGFGYFAEYSALPAWLAWEAFGPKNGTGSLAQMNERIGRYRKRTSSQPTRAGDYEIGCVMIASPVFFPRETWVREPAGWKPNIVTGRYEDLSSGEGLRIFSDCLARAEGLTLPLAEDVRETARADRYGAPVEIRPRLGQGIFRITVLDAYERACAVTREHSLPVLDAAHIRPYGDGGRHEPSNGLALRSDIHRLFDLGYVTVTPDYRFKVSDALDSEYHNGRIYYDLDDEPIHLPLHAEEQPSRELLDWHGETIFRA